MHMSGLDRIFPSEILKHTPITGLTMKFSYIFFLTFALLIAACGGSTSESSMEDDSAYDEVQEDGAMHDDSAEMHDDAAGEMEHDTTSTEHDGDSTDMDMEEAHEDESEAHGEEAEE